MTNSKGGPRTREGKARAAQNALRHGLSAGRSAQGGSFAALDAIHVQALDAQESILRVAEQNLASLSQLEAAQDMDDLDKSLKALIAVERYVGRSFTKRQSVVRRDFNAGSGH